MSLFFFFFLIFGAFLAGPWNILGGGGANPKIIVRRTVKNLSSSHNQYPYNKGSQYEAISSMVEHSSTSQLSEWSPPCSVTHGTVGTSMDGDSGFTRRVNKTRATH